MANRRIEKKQAKAAEKNLALKQLQTLQSLRTEEAKLDIEIKKIRKEISKSKATLLKLREINRNLESEIARLQKIQGLKTQSVDTERLNMARQAGISEAEKIMTENWKINQVKVAEAIGALKALYEGTDTSNFSSDELIYYYDAVYIRGEIPELNKAEREEVIEGLKKMGYNVEEKDFKKKRERVKRKTKAEKEKEAFIQDVLTGIV